MVIAGVDLLFVIIASLSMLPLFLLDGKHVDIALGFNIIKLALLVAQLLFISRLFCGLSIQLVEDRVKQRRQHCLFIYIS